MQWIKWLAIVTAVIIITACFFTWVSIDEKNFFVGGFSSSENSSYGEPGLFHTIFCVLYILLLLFNRVWSLRTAFFIAALNIAWSVRNFFVITVCSGGVCPQKHTAFYVVIFASVLLIILTPLIKVKIKIPGSTH